MRKRKKGRKFGREKDQRRALLKSLALNFILKEKIKTTLAKTKTLSSFVEKQITRAKTDNLSNRRMLTSLLSKTAAKKLVEEIAPRYRERKGGYARIIKLGPRKSDSAKMAIIELVK